MNSYDEIEQNVIEQDEVIGTDTNVNPDYHIHMCIRDLKDGLKNPNFKDGLLQYTMLVEHLVILCKAANYIDENDLRDKKEEWEKEISKEIDASLRSAKLAQKKMEVCLRNVFQTKVSTHAHRA